MRKKTILRYPHVKLSILGKTQKVWRMGKESMEGRKQDVEFDCVLLNLDDKLSPFSSAVAVFGCYPASRTRLVFAVCFSA
jgi:hypothetical protein